MSLQQSWIEKNIYNVHSFTCYLFIYFSQCTMKTQRNTTKSYTLQYNTTLIQQKTYKKSWGVL